MQETQMEHGKASAYRSKKACRCDECTAANTERARQEREDRRTTVLDPNDERHGNYTTYANWGCRCDACSLAMKKHNHDSNVRRKEKREEARLAALKVGSSAEE